MTTKTSFALILLSLVALLALNISCSHHYNHRRGDSANAGHTHIVEKGDTLFGLSKQYSIPVDDLVRVNSLDRTASLRIGQPIYIPGFDSKTSSQMARERIVNADPSISLVDPLDARTIALIWPVQKGVLFRTFDQTPTRLHEGLSIGAPSKTPVVAAQEGEVIFAANANNHFGKMVIVKHDEPFVSIYGHLDTINVAVGKKVRQGETLGTVGSSGGVESPRVYFQLRKNRTPVNPEPYLSKSS